MAIESEVDSDQSIVNVDKNLPLDEKLSFDDYKNSLLKKDMIGNNEETNSVETQWAEFHRCKNRITFAFQLVSVLSVQGKSISFKSSYFQLKLYEFFLFHISYPNRI